MDEAGHVALSPCGYDLCEVSSRHMVGLNCGAATVHAVTLTVARAVLNTTCACKAPPLAVNIQRLICCTFVCYAISQPWAHMQSQQLDFYRAVEAQVDKNIWMFHTMVFNLQSSGNYKSKLKDSLSAG